MTTIYLIRHSVRLKKEEILEYNTNQDKLIKEEKIILSPLGEERAKILSEKDEFDNIDKIYVSNCVRTLQTAKYLMERHHLKCTIDDRLDERRVGIPNEDEVPDWFTRQFNDEDYKTVGGESQKEVRERVSEVIDRILEEDKDKRICVFSHGYAMMFYLLKYCSLDHIDKDRLTLSYKDKVIFNRVLSAPEVFKLTFNDKEITNIELIEFDDLDFNLGV